MPDKNAENELLLQIAQELKLLRQEIQTMRMEMHDGLKNTADAINRLSYRTTHLESDMYKLTRTQQE